MKIVLAPHQALSQLAKPVGKIDKSTLDIIHGMTKALDNAKDPEGVGLAAPQVGKSLQIFVVRQTKKSPLLTFINPKIMTPLGDPVVKKKKKKESSVKLEGCLSLQDVWGVVYRHPSVVLEYMDEEGTIHQKKFTGFLATIIQHEVDHLNGILFPKRVIEQDGQLYKSSKDKKGETVFEEISL
jgi:peptide deformylase